MSWHITGDLAEFLDTAGPFLRARPVENTVFLTLAATLRERGPHFYGSDDPIYGWWTVDGEVRGACLQTPPWPVLLTAVPPGVAAALAQTLAGRPLTGVNALTADAEAFAATWGLPFKPSRHTRLFRLAELTPPDPGPAGAARVATETDRALLLRWLAAFHEDIDEPREEVASQVDDKLSSGGWILWEVGGEPVSMAGFTLPDAGMARVVAVYTPPEQRRHGYGGAATVAATRAAIERGATDVVLFTDLANPTSNALYQRLGYRPVEDRSVLEFEA